MSVTIVRQKNQTTLPADVLKAAGIHAKDQVEWRFEDGEIRGRKLVPDETVEILEQLPRKMGKVSPASIRQAVKDSRR